MRNADFKQKCSNVWNTITTTVLAASAIVATSTRLFIELGYKLQASYRYQFTNAQLNLLTSIYHNILCTNALQKADFKKVISFCVISICVLGILSLSYIHHLFKLALECYWGRNWEITARKQLKNCTKGSGKTQFKNCTKGSFLTQLKNCTKGSGKTQFKNCTKGSQTAQLLNLQEAIYASKVSQPSNVATLTVHTISIFLEIQFYSGSVNDLQSTIS